MRYSIVKKRSILGPQNYITNSAVQVKSGSRKHSGILIFCGKLSSVIVLFSSNSFFSDLLDGLLLR